MSSLGRELKREICPLGIVVQATVMEGEEAHMTVARILEKKGNRVHTIRDDAPLSDAIRELARHHIGILVVTNSADQIMGIVSERDVIRDLAESDFDVSKPVSTIMTYRVTKCTPDDTEGDIMERMGKLGVRHLPVEYAGKIVGVVSARDILNLRIEKLNELMQEIRLEAARRA